MTFFNPLFEKCSGKWAASGKYTRVNGKSEGPKKWKNNGLEENVWGGGGLKRTVHENPPPKTVYRNERKWSVNEKVAAFVKSVSIVTPLQAAFQPLNRNQWHYAVSNRSANENVEADKKCESFLTLPPAAPFQPPFRQIGRRLAAFLVDLTIFSLITFIFWYRKNHRPERVLARIKSSRFHIDAITYTNLMYRLT